MGGNLCGGLNKMLRSADGSVLGFKRFNKQNALFPDDVINSITEDNRDAVGGHHNGLIEFDPETEVYKTYDLMIFKILKWRIVSNQKVEWGFGFGGINGINVFTPPNSTLKMLHQELFSLTLM